MYGEQTLTEFVDEVVVKLEALGVSQVERTRTAELWATIHDRRVCTWIGADFSCRMRLHVDAYPDDARVTFAPKGQYARDAFLEGVDEATRTLFHIRAIDSLFLPLGSQSWELRNKLTKQGALALFDARGLGPSVHGPDEDVSTPRLTLKPLSAATNPKVKLGDPPYLPEKVAEAVHLGCALAERLEEVWSAEGAEW